MKDNRVISTNKSTWFPFLIFVLGGIVIGAAGYFLGGSIGSPSGTLPPATLPNLAFYIIWPCVLAIFSLATYFFWQATKTESFLTKKWQIGVYYLILLLLMFWPLTFYRLDATIVSCIIIGIATLLSIYIVYCYLIKSVTAGVLACIWAVWLMYIFYINLSHILVN